MTKEELEKEAIQSAKKFFGKPTDLVDLDNLRIFKNGYLTAAEPREKWIAHLEAQIEQNKIDLAISEHDREHDDYEFTEVYTKVEQLEKENAKLKCNCRTCVYTDSPCVRSDYPSKDGVCSHYKNVFEEKAELKQENKVLAQNLEDTEILNKTYEKRFDDLEKENAELKKQLEMSNKVYNDNLDYSHHIEEQLTKAKELLKEFVQHYKAKTIYVENMQDLLKQSEQFLSEVEK